MNLVIMSNQQAVTSSIMVSGSFDKRHDHVLRDIEIMQKDVPNFGEMFYESVSPDSYGRERKTYLMNRDGFTLLAMGFTGSNAMSFKLQYINAFNQMEKQQKPKSQLEILQESIGQLVAQEQRLSLVEKKQDNITEILSLNPTEWRKKVNSLVNSIAQSRDGAYADVRKESYELLEDRGACQLSIRLTNRKRKMALEGASKSKIDKVSKMDVIADDARLTEIYLAIVKEMAIKNNVEVVI